MAQQQVSREPKVCLVGKLHTSFLKSTSKCVRVCASRLAASGHAVSHGHHEGLAHLSSSSRASCLLTAVYSKLVYGAAAVQVLVSVCIRSVGSTGRASLCEQAAALLLSNPRRPPSTRESSSILLSGAPCASDEPSFERLLSVCTGYPVEFVEGR